MPAARRATHAAVADLGPSAPRRRGQRVVALAPDPEMPNRSVRRAAVAWAPGSLYAAGKMPLVGLQAAERWRDCYAMAQHGRGGGASFLREGGGGAGVAFAEAVLRAATDLRRCRAVLPPVLATVMDLAAALETPLPDLAAKLRLSEDRAAEAVHVAAMRAAVAWRMV
jgi:hypothetical protein